MRCLSRLLVGFLLASPVAAERPLAYLLQSDGLVELRREAWPSKSYHPAQPGVGLHSGDFLRLADKAHAVALCTDFNTPLWRPNPGEIHAVEQACPRQVGLLALPDGLSVRPRAGDFQDVLILSPRGVVRRNERKVLTVRWVAPSDQLYDVSLFKGSRAIWGPTRIDRTEWRVPSRVVFEPDFSYWVEVRYKGKVYSSTEAPFIVIDQETHVRIENEETTLLELFTKEEPDLRVLAHALYLAHQHLWDEALTRLARANLAPSAATELLRGRLALGLGLATIAEERLMKARTLARSVGDLESQAAALVLSSAAGNSEKERERLREALALYEELGDARQAEDVRRRLDVSRPRPPLP